MALQLPQFQRLSFAESNPGLTGFSAMQDLISNALGQRLKHLEAQKASAELPYAAQMAQATAKYKAAMADYLLSPGGQGRGLSPLGKIFNEQAVFGQSGFPVGTGAGGYNNPNGNMNPQASGNHSPVYDIYGNKILKETTDPKTRERNLFATNIEKTIENINPEDLTAYSGVSGLGKKGMDIFKGLLGKTPERQAKYEEATRMSQALAGQVRQFYGDSITPQVREELQHITNPSSWKYDQKTALRLFDKYKNLLGQEMQTLRDATNSPSVYGFQGQHANQGGNNNMPMSPVPNSGNKVLRWNQKTGRLE
jgi:hypothetical protein